MGGACGTDGTSRGSSAGLGPGLGEGGLETGGSTTDSPDDTGDDEGDGDDSDGGSKFDIGSTPDLPSSDTSDECAATSVEAEVKSQSVDVLIVVDTSSSMGSAIQAVENSINDSFASILEDSGVDYRVIVAGDSHHICITMPLSGSNCSPPPATPATTERYKHYDAGTGSGGLLTNIVNWATAPDPGGLAPSGYVGFFRDDSRKVILAMTDGNSASGSPSVGDAFDNQLLAFNPPVFGTPGDRQYQFYAVVSMSPNNPVESPWLPSDPIQGEGGSIQEVAIVSGGWRFPLSQPGHFDTLFEDIATDVALTTPVACDLPIPDAPAGDTIDPDTIEIDYSPGGVPPVESFHQVTDLAACEADAFYIDADVVHLCPDSCSLVQSDAMAHLDVRYGCDVGYNPAG